MARIGVEISDRLKDAFADKCDRLGVSMSEAIAEYVCKVTGLSPDEKKKVGRKPLNNGRQVPTV